jgi:hypothetical protein
VGLRITDNNSNVFLRCLCQRGVGQTALALLSLQLADKQTWAEVGILVNDLGTKILVSDLSSAVKRQP